MKKFTILLTVLSAILLFNTSAFAAKNILIENLTGTWCGPCGTYKDAIRTLIDENPGRVFVCEMHIGNDPFKIPEADTISGVFGNGGVPSGTVNREPFNVSGQTAFSLHPAQWGQVIPQMLQAENVVDVQAFYSVNTSSRQLSVTVQATFLKALSIPTGEFRFNVYINENNLVGYQANKGNDYNHTHVCRDVLGGVFGLGGQIPASVNAGSKYEYTFTYTLNPSWKIQDLDYYACVMEYGTNNSQLDGNYIQILNATKATEGTPYSEVTTTDPTLAVKPTGEAFSKVFQLRNVSNEQMTYRINDEVSERTPTDWTWTVNASNGIVTKSENTQASEITLNAGLATDITVELTPGATIGIGDLNIEVLNKYDPKGQKSVGTITVLSAEIENLQINDYSDAKYTLMPHMQSAGLSGSLELSNSEFEQVAPFLNNLNILVWNCGEKGTLTASEANKITSAISDDINVFLVGTALTQSTDNSVKSMLSYAGVQFLKSCYQGSSNGLINIIGYQGDPISNGFDQPGKLISYLGPALKAIGPNAKPFLRYKNVDTVVAVHSMVDETRIIVLGINPFVITSDYERNNLIKKCFEWLQGSGPSISCAEDMSFTSTEAGQTTEQTLTLENKGKSALNITDIEVEYDYSANFKLKGDKTFSIPVGGTYDLVMEFKPSYAIQYDSWIRIYSNAENDPIKQVNVSGKGIKASAGPVVSLSISEVSFVDVSVGGNETRKFTVNNTGNQALDVTNITVPGAYTPLFTIEPTSFTVAVGAGQEVNVTFVPLDVLSIETSLTISSNNKDGAVQLPLSANSIVGVEDGTSQSALLRLFAGPNPFSENAKIEFTLNGDMSQQVEIVLIDATGRTVKAIDSKLFEPGTYNYDLNSSDMTSGTYYIIAKTQEYTSQLQIVVVK